MTIKPKSSVKATTYLTTESPLISRDIQSLHGNSLTSNKLWYYDYIKLLVEMNPTESGKTIPRRQNSGKGLVPSSSYTRFSRIMVGVVSTVTTVNELRRDLEIFLGIKWAKIVQTYCFLVL